MQFHQQLHDAKEGLWQSREGTQRYASFVSDLYGQPASYAITYLLLIKLGTLFNF